MRNKSFYNQLIEAKEQNNKLFAVLVDPDKVDMSSLDVLIDMAGNGAVDFFFVGGSLLSKDTTEEVVHHLKTKCAIPVILFPSHAGQIAEEADAILFLSLISGRNADYLIGQQVIAAPLLRQKDIEVLSTGYMLVDCGAQTTASYISNTTPLPYNKPEIAVATAMAGELIGMKAIYADGGSGASTHVSPQMIKAIAKNVDIPLIVGGGIRTADEAVQAWQSGADVIVVGNHIEKSPQFIHEISAKKRVLQETK